MFSRAIIGLALSGMVLASCGGGTTAVSADRRVTIANNTGQTISRFYGSNTGSDSWEEDILGSSVLPPGMSTTINFDDGSGYCTFDECLHDRHSHFQLGQCGAGRQLCPALPCATADLGRILGRSSRDCCEVFRLCNQLMEC